MTVDAIRRMELGQLVDYCIEWNNIHEEQEEGDSSPGNKKSEQGTKRKATQADWDALFGR